MSTPRFRKTRYGRDKVEPVLTEESAERLMGIA